MDKWAAIISHFLNPNAKLVFVEFHPVVWMFDDDFSKIAYSYFNTEPIKPEFDVSFFHSLDKFYHIRH